MKNFLAYIVFFVFLSGVNAQNDMEFCADTSHWYVYNYHSTGGAPGSSPTFSYSHSYQKVEGDTNVNGNVYQKIYRKIFSNQAAVAPINYSFYGYYLNDSGKVYLGTSLSNMQLKYDFSLAVGDSFLFTNVYTTGLTSVYSSVNSIDSVMYNGLWRKRIIFNPIYGNFWGSYLTIKWVEGIGDPDNGPIHNIFDIQFAKANGGIALQCFAESFVPLIGNCNFVGVEESLSDNQMNYFPQPASDILSIESTEVHFESTPLLFDLAGKQIHLSGSFINPNKYLLDLSNLDAGFYLVVINTNKGLQRKKIVVGR